MGGQNSKGEEAHHTHSQLTSEEISNLKKLFNTFATQVAPVGREKALCCSYRDFKAHCESYLQDWLASRVAEKLSIHWPKQEALIPLNHYLALVAHTLKGSLDQKVEVVWKLALPTTPTPRDYITSQEIITYTRSVVESYLKCLESSASYKSWTEGGIGSQPTPDSITDLSLFILSDLLWPGVDNKELKNVTEPPQDSYSLDDIGKCYQNSSLLQQLHASIISCCFRLDVDAHFIHLIPSCSKAHPAFLPQNYSLLDHTRIMFINSHLPQELRKIWRFLFSTAAQGESFAKMVGEIKGKGPTLIVIKDDSGAIFGGFATNSWAYGPKFFGNKDSFLFHLSPKFCIYPSTGYNENFQYMNVQQQTLPNGLGMGGKLEYFGLWLDAEFGKGSSSPSCTTYACPQLSTSPTFSIHHMEVWGLGPEPKDDEGEDGERSILDKDPEAKALLEMVNKGNHSAGYREEPHAGD